MTVLRSIGMAFAMFSIIPMPRLEWKQENMRYMLCALPLVGAVIGFSLALWRRVCLSLSIGGGLYAAGMTLLPLLLSGGIHMDGFCDTVDALSSHAAPERKREILKDPHAGAFAILAAVFYFLLTWACWTELPASPDLFAAAGIFFVLSRAVGALASVLLPPSASRGLLFTFAGAAHKRAAVILALWVAACGAGLIVLSPVGGAVSLLLAAGCFGYLHKMSRREFGGMSGDLAGFLIAGLELVLLFGLTIFCKVVSL